ncbi:MAG: hypothetical protein AAF829_14290, partial [Pseudomonadota bacterium]
MGQQNTDFSGSSFVWVDRPASLRNQFVSFSQTIPKPHDEPVWLHLFADTRFRLFVNGRFIAYGPARFVTRYPEYDSYRLDDYLRDGDNDVRVEVNYYGCSSFQSMPDGKPGFVAAGTGQSYDFVTPGRWQACVHRAWGATSPHFSFAQNPIEICDTRVLERELRACEHETLVPCKDVPWLELRPRSVPYPAYRFVRPRRLVAAGPLRADLTLA